MKSDLEKLWEQLPGLWPGRLVNALESAARLARGQVVIDLEAGEIKHVRAQVAPARRDKQTDLLKLLDDLPPQESE